MKKRRLKRWVKVVLKSLGGIAAIVLLVLLFKAVGNNSYNDMYQECDNAKGYTCSYYEARLYSIKGE